MSVSARAQAELEASSWPLPVGRESCLHQEPDLAAPSAPQAGVFLLLLALQVGRGHLVQAFPKLEGTRQLTGGSGVEKCQLCQKEGPNVLLGN